MREQILVEIKRLAKANSGRAPGRRVFEVETGIRPHQWRGKYWARWGDALKEAGFSANELQQKLDLSAAFAKMAAAVRHYSREPTVAELEMFQQTDLDFPRYKSVIGHFSSKSELFDTFSKWAASTEGYGDIAALLPLVVAKTKQPSTPSAIEGHVYLIKSGTFYKIGRGDELEKRIKQIRVALPDASELVHSIKTDDPSGIEAYWHRRFADKRANGEWFKLSFADVAAFRRRNSQ